MFYFLIFIGLIYFIGFAILRYGFKRMHTPLIPIDYKPSLKFSIIVPARNEEHNIVELIHSFRQLNYPESHYELIIVDDFSEDDTMLIISYFQNLDSRIQVIKNAKPGLVNALNLGIKESSNEWIARCDVDDTYDANRINIQKKSRLGIYLNKR
jgi:glycosyltransferase involved in cell wall biosynthesis